MATAVFRYRTKPEAADENLLLIEKVFAELSAVAPPDLTYASFRLDDGVTFVHVVDGEGLTDLTAFQEFQRNLADRFDGDLIREEATRIGSYSA
ncbi:hypothetical protein GCM10009554_21670 [Kribbella koreensis]|uniref:Quinol monooxygenase YgiN n=1 Tax=Kribbella koreensis TaxID=57909 RepID=A0ABN1PYS1_9ACTN